MTCPCSVSRLVAGCRDMLWELAVLCQRLLILPIARQAAGAGGWGVIGGSPLGDVLEPAHRPHQRAEAGGTHQPAPSEQRCTKPLGTAGGSGSRGAPRGTRLAGDTSGDGMEVTFSAQQDETPSLHPNVPPHGAGCSTGSSFPRLRAGLRVHGAAPPASSSPQSLSLSGLV